MDALLGLVVGAALIALGYLVFCYLLAVFTGDDEGIEAIAEQLPFLGTIAPYVYLAGMLVLALAFYAGVGYAGYRLAKYYGRL